MAHITLTGTLLTPAGKTAYRDQIRFTHKSTTGETVRSSVDLLTIIASGFYYVELEYGLVLIEYKSANDSQFKNLGVATVNGTNPSTSIPELLNGLVPVSSAELIQFQAILADTVTAKNESVTARNEAEAFAASIDLINDLSQSYVFDTVALMQSSTIVFPVGKILCTGGTKWRVNSSALSTRGFITLTTGLGAFPVNDLFVDDFGGKGDCDGTTGNGTDNSTAFKDAADLAITSGNWVAFSGGKYRFGGAPYAFAGNNSALMIRGTGSQQMDSNPVGSTLLLDGINSFMTVAPTYGTLRVESIECEAITFTIDRPFFDFTLNTCSHTFKDMTFNGVERPIVYRAGIYFQSGSLTNVTFRSSGTIHSETLGLISTLYTLNNVNHEGVIPANTAKVLCSLTGIRNIQATNFLLEGARTADFNLWVILDLGTTYNADWTKSPAATFNGCHIEFSGAEPDALYDVRQTQGTVVINDTNGFISHGTNRYALFGAAKLITNSLFIEQGFTLEDNFYFDDDKCRVVLTNSGIRFNTHVNPSNQQIRLESCWLSNSPAAEVGAIIDNTDRAELYRFKGEAFDPSIITTNAYGGSSITLNTSATYGRIMKLIPLNNGLNSVFRFHPNGLVKKGETLTIKMGLDIPVFTGNSISVFIQGDGVNLSGAQLLTGNNEMAVSAVMLADYTEIQINIGLSAVTAIADPIEIYYFELISGGSYSTSFYTPYPSTVRSIGSSAPNSGSHALGDNVSPNGGATGFYCTVAGSPGTWVAY